MPIKLFSNTLIVSPGKTILHLSRCFFTLIVGHALYYKRHCPTCIRTKEFLKRLLSSRLGEVYIRTEGAYVTPEFTMYVTGVTRNPVYEFLSPKANGESVL